jgi:hypothetical protein
MGDRVNDTGYLIGSDLQIKIFVAFAFALNDPVFEIISEYNGFLTEV